MHAAPEDPGLTAILEHLKALEQRIARIEEELDIQPVPTGGEPAPRQEDAEAVEKRDEALEIEIAQYWFPKVGIVVLAIGIAFLLTFPYKGLHPALPGIFGYILVGGAFFLARRLQDSFAEIARYVFGGALVLLYFTTLRLFFFSPDTLITDRNVELILLLVVVIFSIVLSIRRGSIYLAAISLTTGYGTALIGGELLFVILVSSALAGVAAYLARRFDWKPLLLYAVLLTYLTHTIWAVNNPVLGNTLRLVSPAPGHILVVLLYASILACGTLFRRAEPKEEGIVIVTSFMNGLGAYGLYLLVTLEQTGSTLAAYHGVASVVFLLTSIAFWRKEKSKYSTFVYAMLGYTAMSVAIISYVSGPEYFVWLAWQSIIVVSTAIWFRSRFIIGANFVIFLILFGAYVFIAGATSTVILSFGFVAVLTARLLNWQKDRLELKTEMMRNAYLTCAFFIFPLALYHTLPQAYVSISWVAVAVFYYMMSIMLKSRKYRWMALLTLCLAVGHVFIVDLVKLQPAFRIISFLVLGIVLTWLSFVYAKKKGKR